MMRMPFVRPHLWMTCLVFTATLCASPAVPAEGESGAVPQLLDRELFFGNPEIVGADLSPDGRYVAFLKPWNETRNVWVKRTDEPFEKAHLVTAEAKRPIPGFVWTRDSRYILFVQDKDGDENYNVYAVDPVQAPAPGQAAPPARDLTGVKGARTLIYDLPKAQPDTIYIGLNDRDAAWHDLYKVKISTGEKTLVRQNTERISGWVFDLAGKLRLAGRVADNGDTEILRVDDQGFKKIYSCTVFESCGIVRFHKAGRRVYLETNHGDDIDLTRLILLDPDTGEEELVESDPEKRVDFGHAAFSQATEELVATFYEDDRPRAYYRDKEIEADQRWLEAKLPGKVVSVSSATANDRLWLVTARSDTEPGETYLFDRDGKNLTFQYRIRERLPREALAEMKPLRYRSTDDLEIPAFLTLPKGVAPKALPLIVLPHGGPWARDAWGYDGWAQFLANRGYAVLQPNFRGSTGYGKAFLNAGNGEWGRKMQDDLTLGAQALVAQGVADPKRVGIMGASYGGYATLAGVAFTPDVYSAAVSIVGPSNLKTLLDSIPPYWEAMRTILYRRMADPGTAAGEALLERESPLTAADKIRTPLLIAQGANDPRVKKAESDQIVVALRDRGFPVEYLVAPDEGHGFARPVNNMALFAAAERFLAKFLHGRFQESATPEVAERLKEITVDPRTVVLTPKADLGNVTAPTPAVDLMPGESRHAGQIEAGGQSMPVSVSRKIEDAGATWVIIDSVQMPMGDALDTTVVQKGSLQLVKRTVKQGPAEIELEVSGGRLTGTMSMGGPAQPLAVDLGGPLFADGAGATEALAALPLAADYTAVFRNFDVMKQKVALKKVAVTAQEDVMVAAGQFATWKLEVASAEGDPGTVTVWVDRDSRRVVKSVASLPEMGGAIVTTELQP